MTLRYELDAYELSDYLVPDEQFFTISVDSSVQVDVRDRTLHTLIWMLCIPSLIALTIDFCGF